MSSRPPVRTDLPLVALASGFVLCGLAALAGLPLAGSLATSAACLMLLVFGLPHGTLDLQRIRDQARGPAVGMILLLTVYLGLATAMLLVWRAAPVAALALFIGVAVVHFSEDWVGTGSGFLDKGLALALLVGPTMLHRSELDALFVALTGSMNAPVVAEIMTLLMPVALVVAVVAIAAFWSTGQRGRALAGGLALAGMVLLPPVVGFALYFCLFHSPRHLGESLRELRLPPKAAWISIILPLTLTAGAIAAGLFGLEFRADTASRLVATSFMTLSVLTMPHMLAPTVTSWFLGVRSESVVPSRGGRPISGYSGRLP